MLQKTFENLCGIYTNDKELVLKFWREIELAYSAPTRHYHTLIHLENVYSHLQHVKENIKHWDAVLFALFYHDIVYISPPWFVAHETFRKSVIFCILKGTHLPAMHTNTTNNYHALWVKLTHWLGTLAFLLLLFTGIEMIMVHPRFYWGETGNELTPALFELPISRNYHHGGWTTAQAFFSGAASPVSAGRTYEIFNQNGWGRSLHFLSAWILVITGLTYLVTGLVTRHLQTNILPGSSELSKASMAADIKAHIRKGLAFIRGPQYGVLQKISYSTVLFILLPVVVITGLTMSPAVTASCPFLLTICFGAQSARTIHFFAAALLTIFLFIHIAMIIRTGFKQHLRAMTVQK